MPVAIETDIDSFVLYIEQIWPQKISLFFSYLNSTREAKVR